ncbi:hypothetical protein WG66_002173 [Moniliophthora roreri]|nr:hypothetical protein WG66_002173 [Moniliophthora roreri]
MMSQTRVRQEVIPSIALNSLPSRCKVRGCHIVQPDHYVGRAPPLIHYFQVLYPKHTTGPSLSALIVHL